MNQQQDTIVSQQETPAVKTDSGTTVSAHRITPYQVLRMLPRDATPDQQDSAIQAWFQPSQIRYSNRPDTLHLPGHDVPVDLSVVNIPVYYREAFFAKELAAPESHPGRYGVAGDPVPYTVRGDNTMTLLLLFCVEKNYPRTWWLKWAWLGISAVVFVLMMPAISGIPCTKEYATFIENVLAPFGKVYYGDIG
jgi:hypothetical protein